MRMAILAGACLLALSGQGWAGAERGECTPTSLIWKTDDTPQTIKPVNRPVDIRGMTQSFTVTGPEPGCVIVTTQISKQGGICADGPAVTLDGASADLRFGSGLLWVNVPPGNHQIKVQINNRRCSPDLNYEYERQILEVGERSIIIQRD